MKANKSLRFFLEIVSGAIAIVAAIIFFIMDRQILGGDIRFSDSSYMTLIFIIAAGVVAILDAFFSLPFVGIASAILFGLGLGSHLRLACYPMADLGQGVAFFTGDTAKAQSAVNLFMTFLVIFGIAALAIVVCNFLPNRKKES